MGAATDVLDTVMRLTGAGPYTSGLNSATVALLRHQQQIQQASRAVDVFSARSDLAQRRAQLWSRTAMLSGTAAAGMAAGLGGIVRSAADLQQVRVAFTTLEGSAQAANTRIAEMQQFAAQTPFSFQDTVQGAQRLRAMGIEGNKVLPIMRAVGDAVSAAGGSGEDYQGALRAITQIKSKGKVTAEELEQLAERNINAYRAIASEMGVTEAQLRKQMASGAGLSSDRGLDLLTRGLSGQYAGAMARQMDTFNGSLSNVLDTMDRLKAGSGEGLLQPFTKGIQGANRFLELLETAPKPVKELTGYIGVGLVGGLALYSVGAKLAADRSNFLAVEFYKEALAAQTAEKSLRALALTQGQVAATGGAGAFMPVGGTGGGAAGGGISTTTTAAAAAAAAGLRNAPAAASTGSKFMRTMGSPKVGIAALLAELGLGFLPDDGGVGSFKRVAQSTATGIGIGSAVGLVIPGSSAPLAIGGGAIGAGIGIYNEMNQGAVLDKPLKDKGWSAASEKSETELTKIREVLERMESNGGGVLPTDVSPLRVQRMAFGRLADFD